MACCRPVTLSASLVLLPVLLLAEGPPPARPSYLLDRDGKLFVWIPGQTAVQPISVPWPRVNDLAPSAAGGRLLILTATPTEGAARHVNQTLDSAS